MARKGTQETTRQGDDGWVQGGREHQWLVDRELQLELGDNKNDKGRAGGAKQRQQGKANREGK